MIGYQGNWNFYKYEAQKTQKKWFATKGARTSTSIKHKKTQKWSATKGTGTSKNMKHKKQKWFATKGTGTSPVSSLEILTGILYGTVTTTLWNKDRF